MNFSLINLTVKKKKKREEKDNMINTKIDLLDT